jgi:hypothetical protein
MHRRISKMRNTKTSKPKTSKPKTSKRPTDRSEPGRKPARASTKSTKKLVESLAQGIVCYESTPITESGEMDVADLALLMVRFICEDKYKGIVSEHFKKFPNGAVYPLFSKVEDEMNERYGGEDDEDDEDDDEDEDYDDEQDEDDEDYDDEQDEDDEFEDEDEDDDGDMIPIPVRRNRNKRK